MADTDFARVRRIFEDAAELALETRGAFLDQQCGDDAELHTVFHLTQKSSPSLPRPSTSQSAPSPHHATKRSAVQSAGKNSPEDRSTA